MAADYAFNWTQSNRPESLITFSETNLQAAVERYVALRNKISVIKLNEEIRGKLINLEIQLARDLELSSERVGLAIDSYLKPASLMALALSGKFNSIFDGLPIEAAFIEKLQQQLAKVVPYSLQKFNESYSPLNEFRAALRAELGLTAYLQSKRMHFEFEGMPWIGPVRRGQRRAKVYSARTIVGTYAAAIDRIKRAQESFARLSPKSDFVQTALSALAHTLKCLEAELREFPDRFKAYAASEITGSTKKSEAFALNQKWLDEYAENIRIYSNNPREYVCARALGRE